ncbi:hypothetical protein ACQEU3_43930 [Spirillospora sp. CA-253888]
MEEAMFGTPPLPAKKGSESCSVPWWASLERPPQYGCELRKRPRRPTSALTRRAKRGMLSQIRDVFLGFFSAELLFCSFAKSVDDGDPNVRNREGDEAR